MTKDSTIIDLRVAPNTMRMVQYSEHADDYYAVVTENVNGKNNNNTQKRDGNIPKTPG